MSGTAADTPPLASPLLSARSLRGLGHVISGLPCQDFSKAVWLPEAECGVGILADGGGSRDLAEIGARLLVDAAIALISAGTAPGLREAEPTQIDAFWFDLCVDLRDLLDDEAAASADPQALEPHAAMGDFAATFLAFLLWPERMACMQIGDGFIAYSTRAEPRHYKLAVEPTTSEVAGEVVWITSSRWREDFRSSVINEPVDFVCAATDGVEGVALKNHGRGRKEPFYQFFSVVHDAILQANDSNAVDEYVKAVLTMPDLDRKTDDDKTLVIAARGGAQSAARP